MKQHGKENEWRSMISEGTNEGEALRTRRAWYLENRREMRYRAVADLGARARLLYRQTFVALSLACRDGVEDTDGGVPDEQNRW